MIKISPYLTFNGNCREAMTFYSKCLGGELSFQAVSETPIAEQCPEGMQQQIMHSQLLFSEAALMATDMSQSRAAEPGNDMAISLSFDNENELLESYSRLSNGGKIIEPLKKAFGNALFGVLKDRYGKVWMFHHQN